MFNEFDAAILNHMYTLSTLLSASNRKFIESDEILSSIRASTIMLFLCKQKQNK